MSEMKFAKSHEWVQFADDDTAFIGITDYAQKELGDIVFVNLPEVGDVFDEGEVFADVESVKAVSDLYLPVSGTVAEVNEALLDAPELINEDCYEAWLVKLAEVSAGDELLTEDEYNAFIATGGE